MSLKERINQINNSVLLQKEKTEKALQSRTNNQELEVQTIIQQLEISEFLTEIKDELWTCGELSSKKQTVITKPDEDKNYKHLMENSCFIPEQEKIKSEFEDIPSIKAIFSLASPAWFSLRYYPGDYRDVSDPDHMTTEFIPSYYSISKNTKEIEISIENKRTVEYSSFYSIKLSHWFSNIAGDSYPYHNGYESGDKTILIDINKINDSIEINKIKKEIQDWFLIEMFTKDKLSNNNSLKDEINKDREEIKEKIGLVRYTNVHKDFRPDEEEAKILKKSEQIIETQTDLKTNSKTNTQKRSFLDKILGE